MLLQFRRTDVFLNTNFIHLKTLALLFLLFSALDLSAQTFDFLDVNNVNARFYSNGELCGGDSLTNGFEVPIGSGKQTIFDGGLWIAGYDNSHNLRVAAQTNHQIRNDFFPGPLPCDTNTIFWNRVWKVSRLEIDTFVSEFNNGFPNSNYLVPNGIQAWPGTGDSTLFQDHLIAPFVDVNHDGKYNFHDGDYPCIKGDQAVYFIFNAGVVSQSQLFPVGVEIHGMAYAFQSQDSYLNNSIFLNYKIINKNTTTSIDSAYIGSWTDFKLGSSNDDYIACDVQRNMYYVYNGDANDEGSNGYGFNPPAQGIVFLRGIDAEIGDNIDNDRDSCVDCTLFHTQSGDSIVPDYLSPERIPMTNFMYYNNNNDSISGNPNFQTDLYGYMRSFWKNTSHLTYGGNGKGMGPGGTTDLADFMFPGNSDPYFWGTNGIPEAMWDEVSAGNLPGSRRGVASMGPFSLLPGEEVCIDYAYVYARTDSGGQVASVDSLKSAVDRVRNFYNAHQELQTCDCTPPSLTAISNIKSNISGIILFPDPASEYSSLQFTLKKVGNTAIEILDETGRLIKMINPKTVLGKNSVALNVGELADGIYFIRINCDGNLAFKKLIKN